MTRRFDHPSARLGAAPDRRWLLGSSAAFAGIAAFAPSAAQGSLRAPRMRIASSGNTDLKLSGEYVWLDAFIQSARSDGFNVIFYPGSSLGKEAERTELVNLDLVQLNISGLSEIQAYSHLARVLGIPFLFECYEQFDRLLHASDFLDEVNAELSATNMRVLDAALLGGMSGLFTTRTVVHSLDDLRGIRLRAMNRSDMQVIGSWGSKSVQVAWEEIAQALETGIAEGYLNPPLVPIIFGHNAQIRHFSDLRLFPSARWVVVSRRWYETLSASDHLALQRALESARTVNRYWTGQTLGRERDTLEASGISYFQMPDTERAKFAAISHALYQDHPNAAALMRVRQWIQEPIKE